MAAYRPKRSCRKELPSDVFEPEPKLTKRRRNTVLQKQPENVAKDMKNVILTPNTSSSKTGEQTESLEPSGSRNGHVAVVGLPGILLKKDSELAIKFMDEERMKLPAMQQDLSHLDTNFRHKLVEEWVSKSYDVDYCFSKLRELVDDPKQKHREIIQQSMQVILDLSNVRQENNLLRLHLDEKNAELQTLKAQVGAFKAAAAKNPIQID